MEAIELNHLNSTFRIHGSEDKRSLEIRDVEVREWPQEKGLKLLVLDEKDVPIYSQPLSSSQPGGTGTIEVNKRFVFYDHIAVCLEADAVGSPFSAVVKFD